MKRLMILSVMILSLLGLLMFGGCAKESPSEPGNGNVGELDQAYGGFTTADELPAFGDASIAADFDEDLDVTDPITTDPSVSAALDSGRVAAYFIRITWGLLEFDSTATAVINWNGSASVNRGILGIKKSILFEYPGDHIVLPRANRKMVEWISNTITHFDGIALMIIDRDTSSVPGQFTLTTPLYSRTFSFDELDSLQLVETVTAQGHQISIQAYKKQLIPLGGGFLEGRWIKTRANGGIFKGKWINDVGARAGHLRGIWGVNQKGEKVFFGKYISLNGNFSGLLAGNWGYANNTQDGGWFAGKWFNKSLSNIGTLEGHWKAKDDNPRRGFFQGKWKRNR